MSHGTGHRAPHNIADKQCIFGRPTLWILKANVERSESAVGAFLSAQLFDLLGLFLQQRPW
jgi:hypothetical protein